MGNNVKRRGETIAREIRDKISKRYHTVAKAINNEFWDSSSDSSHCLYVGSYGRNTAIDASDVDILVELPSAEFDRYNNLNGNSQSRLLQSVRKAIIDIYPRSDVRADGQVVKINFQDGIKFEILPAFKSLNGSYKYPDSNAGGSWKSTNPKAEQEAMADKNRSSNGLLYDTCKHIRRIHVNNFSSYHLSGIVIDSFAYSAIGSWQWSEKQSTSTTNKTYEEALLYYFNNGLIRFGFDIPAPGSNDQVSTSKSKECLEKILEYMIN